MHWLELGCKHQPLQQPNTGNGKLNSHHPNCLSNSHWYCTSHCVNIATTQPPRDYGCAMYRHLPRLCYRLWLCYVNCVVLEANNAYHVTLMHGNGITQQSSSESLGCGLQHNLAHVTSCNSINLLINEIKLIFTVNHNSKICKIYSPQKFCAVRYARNTVT